MSEDEFHMSDEQSDIEEKKLETTFSNAENNNKIAEEQVSKKKKRHRKRKNTNKKFEIGNSETMTGTREPEDTPFWVIDEPNSDEDDYEDDMVVKISLTRQVERDEIKPILPGGTLRMGNSRVKLTNYKPTERRLYLEFTHLMWLYINEDLEITTFSSYLSAQVFVLFRLGLQMTNGMRDTNNVENGINKEFSVLSINEGNAQKLNDVDKIKDYMDTIEPHQVVVESHKFGVIQYPKPKDFYEVLKNIQPTSDLHECMKFMVQKNKPLEF